MLSVNNKNLCSLCFSELDSNGKCTNCSGESNFEKFPSALIEGTVLAGKYSIGTVLGKGGFGVTYLCYDMKNDKVVAIKEYMPDSLSYRTPGNTSLSSYAGEKANSFKAGAEKFFDEAKLVSFFGNVPSIINVYEFFYENNTAYYVMEYIDGVDLKNYIKMKGGRLTPEEVVYIIAKVSGALKAIHNSNILHRDISPDNIFICHDGNVKLIDFGAARQVLGEASKSLSVILKQGFAPLEQYKKKGNQGPWTDIYALGATMYYALTGKVIDDAMTRLDDETLDMRGIPEDIAALLVKMLKVNISERCQSANELILEIADIRVGQKIPEIPGNSRKETCNTSAPEQVKDKKTPEENNEAEKITSGKESVGDKTKAEQVASASGSAASPKKKVIIFVAVIVVCIVLISSINFKGTYYIIERDGRYGLGDAFGRIVVPAEYDYIAHLTDKVLVVEKNGKSGILKGSELVVPIEYDVICMENDGNIRLVKEDGDSDKRGLYVIDQDKVVPAEYEDIAFMENGYFKFKKDGKYGILDKDYIVVVPAKYDSIYVVIPEEYGSIYDMEKVFVVIEKDGKYGIMDKNYNLIEPAEYDVIYHKNGCAKYKKDGKYGLYVADKATWVPAKYDYIDDFNNGYAKFKKNGKEGKFDLNLNEIYD